MNISDPNQLRPAIFFRSAKKHQLLQDLAMPRALRTPSGPSGCPNVPWAGTPRRWAYPSDALFQVRKPENHKPTCTCRTYSICIYINIYIFVYLFIIFYNHTSTIDTWSVHLHVKGSALSQSHLHLPSLHSVTKCLKFPSDVDLTWFSYRWWGFEQE